MLRAIDLSRLILIGAVFLLTMPKRKSAYR
jgi:hypothetical protein